MIIMPKMIEKREIEERMLLMMIVIVLMDS